MLLTCTFYTPYACCIHVLFFFISTFQHMIDKLLKIQKSFFATPSPDGLRDIPADLFSRAACCFKRLSSLLFCNSSCRLVAPVLLLLLLLLLWVVVVVLVVVAPQPLSNPQLSPGSLVDSIVKNGTSVDTHAQHQDTSIQVHSCCTQWLISTRLTL